MSKDFETVIAESNGHEWIYAFDTTCCRKCGFVRRRDDLNKPCKGVVNVALRSAFPPALCTPTENKGERP